MQIIFTYVIIEIVNLIALITKAEQHITGNRIIQVIMYTVFVKYSYNL
jgi:hypothetical protein